MREDEESNDDIEEETKELQVELKKRNSKKIRIQIGRL